MMYDKHDQETTAPSIMYDTIHDRFVCAFCADDFTISQLHDTFGGNLLPVPMKVVHKTMRALRKEPCLICELPCSRFADA